MAGNGWKLLLEGKNGQFYSIKQLKLGKSWAKESNILRKILIFSYTQVALAASHGLQNYSSLLRPEGYSDIYISHGGP